MIVLDAVECIDVEVDGFRVFADEGPVRDTVEIVMPRDDILPVDLLCPPPQRGHAVLLGADRDVVGLPVLDEPFHMLGLKQFCLQSPKAQGVKLIRDERQHPLAVLLGGVATIAIMATERLQLVVQVFHRV